jgi:mannose-6-phosphate isomerase-like protein (cupin superfamily)
MTAIARTLLLLAGGSLAANIAHAQPRVVAITKADIDTVLKYVGTEGGATDRQMRVVDLGRYSVAVGVLHRGATRDGAPVGAISHEQVTEVYCILSGGGTLVTGGTIANPVPFPADGEIVKIDVGPSTSGTFQGGDRTAVGPGDVVIIPAGVPHGFADVKDQVTYLSIRPDINHVLPAGYVHPALRK